MKKKKKWDASKWQGRDRSQVEGNYKVLGLTIFTFVVIIIFYSIISLFV